MSYGFLLSAVYESGYCHLETEQDFSPYAPGRNFFYDILHGEPTNHGHGRMMQYSLVASEPDPAGQVTRFDIDWRLLPEDARPVHYMEMSRTIMMLGDPNAVDSGPICEKRGFGFTFTDPETGETVTQVIEVTMDPDGTVRVLDEAAEPDPTHLAMITEAVGAGV